MVSRRKSETDFVALAVAIIICELAGVIGALFTTPNIPTWYAGLAKPAMAPGGMFISMVWLLLYAMMGVSLYFIWERGPAKPAVKAVLVVFAIQLILNVLWSYMFFGLRSPFLGLVEIAVLILAVAYLVWKSHKVSPMASWLLAPYLIWLFFAAILNFLIWQMNP